MSTTMSAMSGSVTLRNPDLGDSDSFNVKSRFLRSMGGNIYGYRFTPPDSTLLLRWSFLNVTDRADLFAFLKDTVGEEVTLLMEYNTAAPTLANPTPLQNTLTWVGKIISDPFEFQTTGRHGDTCIEVGTITLQFRGVPAP